MPSAQSIAHYLRADHQFKPLAQQAQCLAEFEQIFARLLPPSLQRSVRPAYWDAGVLLVMADNGAIAAKLKQLVPNLLFQLEKQGHKISAIRVAVQVGAGAPPPRPKTEISRASLAHWQELAENLEASPLKSAVERLLLRRS